MKIAITSTGNKPGSKIDTHFARCAYFVLYDTDTSDFTFIENTCKAMQSNVGLSAVEFIKKLGVKRIISGEFGLSAKAALDKLSIQMVVITDHEKNIGDIVELLKLNQK